MDILTKIVTHTRQLVEERRASLPLDQLKQRLPLPRTALPSLLAKLVEDRPHIIAEFKRKSPSKPTINLKADPCDIARQYTAGGASALSVLTEPTFFAGSLDDLAAIRPTTDLPLLRKDFIIDPYQIYEARAHGANLVLLIARILQPAEVAEFTNLAHSLGMEVLFEIHHPDELVNLGDAAVDFLGVNCRDLKKFATNLDHLIAMTADLPPNIPWVAESGITGPQDVRRLADAGYQAFLVGEHLMRSEDPATRLRELVQA